MVLHPAGGGIDHIQRISTVIIATHALAILSVPITLVGFAGLTYLLDHHNLLSVTSFAIVAVGLIAVMIAGTLNGIALPFYAADVVSTPENEAIHKSILRYNYSVNQAMTYVYIGANTLGIMGWSIRIIKTLALKKWVGYFGLVLSIVGALLFLFQFIEPDVFGFRIYIFGTVTWIVTTGFLMMNVVLKR